MKRREANVVAGTLRLSPDQIKAAPRQRNTDAPSRRKRGESGAAGPVPAVARKERKHR